MSAARVVLRLSDVVKRYPGVLALNGGETQFEDHYYRTHVRMECGDERYQWVNRTLFVGEGRLESGGAVYDVYRVT